MRDVQSFTHSGACALGFDASVAAEMLGRDPGDREALSFAEHARECATCARAARAWELVRGAWKAEVDRDEQHARVASERRLAALWPRPKGVPWPWAIAGAVAAAVAATWMASPRRAPTPEPRESPVAQAHAPAAPLASSSAPNLPSAPAPAPSAARRLLAVRSCAACDGVAAGASMRDRDKVVVPRGATLALNWGADGTALVDPASGVDVVGPAVVRTKLDEGEVALVLESGMAQAHTAQGGAVETAFAMTRGTRAAWRVAARAESTRIEVASGEVAVRTAVAQQIVGAGGRLDALADGRLVAPVVSVAPMALPASPGRLAIAAVASAPPASRVVEADRGARERASFALAERELGRGESDDARALLGPLLGAADPSLAGDAAFLLSGSMPTPAARAEVLDRYLAKAPPSPYREQAEVERARALLEAGRAADARAIARALRAEPGLPAVARPGLERLERALKREP